MPGSIDSTTAPMVQLRTGARREEPTWCQLCLPSQRAQAAGRGPPILIHRGGRVPTTPTDPTKARGKSEIRGANRAAAVTAAAFALHRRASGGGVEKGKGTTTTRCLPLSQSHLRVGLVTGPDPSRLHLITFTRSVGLVRLHFTDMWVPIRSKDSGAL